MIKFVRSASLAPILFLLASAAQANISLTPLSGAYYAPLPDGASGGSVVPFSFSYNAASLWGTVFVSGVGGTSPMLTATQYVVPDCIHKAQQACGGATSADLVYQVAVVNSTPGDFSPVKVQLNAKSTIVAPTGSFADAWLEMYGGGNTAYFQEDCGAGEVSKTCATNETTNLAPIVPTSIFMNANTAYTLIMEIGIEPGVDGNTVSATLDPQFFLPLDSPYTLEYSSGVTQASATPEPGVRGLALLGSGILTLLFLGRNWKRQAANR